MAAGESQGLGSVWRVCLASPALRRMFRIDKSLVTKRLSTGTHWLEDPQQLSSEGQVDYSDTVIVI